MGKSAEQSILKLPEGYEVADMYPVTSASGRRFIRATGTTPEGAFGIEFCLNDATTEIVRSLRIVKRTPA